MKKRTLKKSLSLILAVILAAAMCIPSFAASAKKNANPVLIITGFSQYPLSDKTTGEKSFPIPNERIANTVAEVLPSLTTLLAGNRTQADYDAFCDAALPYVNALFDPIACNPDGTVKNTNVGLTYQYPESMAEYDKNSEAYAQAFDDALLRGVAKKIGADKVYVYGLDWRLAPTVVADEIHEWIQHIKEVHRCDKVSLAGISMGGAMISAYLAKYGTESLSNLTMISSAFTGLSYIGSLFNGGVSIDEKGLYNMLTAAVGTDVLSNLLGSTGLVKQVIGIVDDLYAAERDRLYTECLIPAFGYNPGIWAFVPAEWYADAKEFMFAHMDSSDADKAVLEAKIDEYHEIQVNAKANLEAAKKAGVSVAVISNYNFQMPPVSTESAQTGDQVIETIHTSGYATCAEIGKQLPEGTSGKYVSPDRMIDASTCWFPNETWFIKNMKHTGFNDTQNQCAFYAWILTADKQVTVNSNPDYPQFMLYNDESKVLSPLGKLRGDVNFDGRVNLTDARLTLRHVRSLEKLPTLAAEAADMDDNGRISHTDVQLIMDAYAGVTTVSDKEFSVDSIKESIEDTVNGGNSGTGDVLGGITDKIGGVLGSVKDLFGEQAMHNDLSQLADSLSELTLPQSTNEEASAEPQSDAAQAENGQAEEPSSAAAAA